MKPSAGSVGQPPSPSGFFLSSFSWSLSLVVYFLCRIYLPRSGCNQIYVVCTRIPSFICTHTLHILITSILEKNCTKSSKRANHR